MARGGVHQPAVIFRKPEHDPKRFGHIPGSPVGTTWPTRSDCSRAGVHAPLQAGIHGSKNTGAYSVVISGGYEDDSDHGETFIYTGQGGRDPADSEKWAPKQAADQSLHGIGNKALFVSSQTGKSIRVVRGNTKNEQSNPYAPEAGYRYDGLYRVTEAFTEPGKQGFMMCRFRFERLPDQPTIPRRWATVDTSRIRKLQAARQLGSSTKNIDTSRINKGRNPAPALPLTNHSNKQKAASSSEEDEDEEDEDEDGDEEDEIESDHEATTRSKRRREANEVNERARSNSSSSTLIRRPRPTISRPRKVSAVVRSREKVRPSGSTGIIVYKDYRVLPTPLGGADQEQERKRKRLENQAESSAGSIRVGSVSSTSDSKDRK